MSKDTGNTSLYIFLDVGQNRYFSIQEFHKATGLHPLKEVFSWFLLLRPMVQASVPGWVLLAALGVGFCCCMRLDQRDLTGPERRRTCGVRTDVGLAVTSRPFGIRLGFVKDSRTSMASFLQAEDQRFSI